MLKGVGGGGGRWDFLCVCFKIPDITNGWLLLRWGTRVCRWEGNPVFTIFCAVFSYSFDCKQRRMYGQPRFPISSYLFWHLKDSEVKRAFPCNSWEDTELLEAGQEPRHQRDGFITCVLSLGQKGRALSSIPARVMRFRLAIVWGTGELSAEQGRGELREVGDGDLSMEPGSVGAGGGGKTKEGGGQVWAKSRRHRSPAVPRPVVWVPRSGPAPGSESPAAGWDEALHPLPQGRRRAPISKLLAGNSLERKKSHAPNRRSLIL